MPTEPLRERIEAAIRLQPATIDDQVEAVMVIVDDALYRARNSTGGGRCRGCGAKDVMPGDHHRMDCRNYVGPLTHEMRYDGINPTFGAYDYRCTCGGYRRSAETTAPECPHAAETHRPQRAEIIPQGGGDQ